MGVAMVALAISTILNAVYFIRAVITIYTPKEGDVSAPEGYRVPGTMAAALVCFILLNVFLGTWSNQIEDAIRIGLSTFS